MWTFPQVLSLLVDETVGRLAADGFYIIMADFEEVMNVKMHVNYKVRATWCQITRRV